jgi:uncharacterized Ntn-hydrolase superfamily protein
VPVRAAGVVVAERDPWPLIDLRIDWSDADPVDELSRLWHLWRPQMRDFLVRALDPATAAAAAAQAPDPR